TYTAITAGTNLVATLQLSDWSGSVSAAAYSIIAAAPAESTSTIDTDGTSYVAGGDIVVTVELKDANGNPVSEQTAALEVTGAVTVPNATFTGSWAESSTVGTYTATYTAITAGTNLVATLQLSDWSGSVSAAAYSIIAAAPAEVNSSIDTDRTSYVAGGDIVVTVELKDANGNPVSEQTAALEVTGAVTVPNATFTGSWAESSTVGTYTATYTAITAGTNLVATLQLSDWSGSVSAAAYSITADVPAQTTSTIDTDLTSYVAGGDIVVTVELKDANGNPVTGQTAALEVTGAVTVPNATFTGSWAESSTVGTYTATYTATTAGTNLVATLQLSDWSGSVSAAAYSITADVPAELNSSIGTDQTSYVAGGDIVVTVELKDANGNPVTEQSGRLTPDTVTVPHTTFTGAWAESSTVGTYTATYTAITAGTNLVATLQLSDWSGSVSAENDYSITAGEMVPANSTVTLEDTTLPADGASTTTVTYTAQDAYGNAVSGLTPDYTLTGSETGTTFDDFTETSTGIYTGTLTAGTTTGGTAALMPQVNGSDAAKEPAQLTLEAVPVITSVFVNDHTFAAGEGFPTTGFNNATFWIQINNATPATDKWVFSSSASWVTVTNTGAVTFGADGVLDSTVTITATPTRGHGLPLTYEFTLSQWFESSSSDMPWSEASAYCEAKDSTLPLYNQMTNATSIGSWGSRDIGNLYSEWGDMSQYPGWQGISYWSSEKYVADYHYVVRLNNGGLTALNDVLPRGVACRRGL
ncbi:MAG: invasin domain 3-containing protein, partial [Serratia sp. (in: enterobacteria)]|uniref:invasin domain 3-containing protein n=1 Tax=Serratia sp. (in: enterobacteria) TaxID=616 RepID=UPI003F2D40F4